MSSSVKKQGVSGRGSQENLPNRFESLNVEYESSDDEDAPKLRTEVFIDQSRSIIATNESPDVPFDASLNPYRGCEHGCVYCYARPTHEYLGFSSGLDFETKIMAKLKAPELLRRELSSPAWQPKVLAMSGVTDCYQPIEKQLKITRACLEVLAEFRNPVGIITKNHLVTRDIDLLQDLARDRAAAVFLSITTLDPHLARILEPRASSPQHRLEALRSLSEAKIPVGVIVAPVIPAINDSEIPAILQAAYEAGARSAGYVIVRLPFAVKQLFSDWLELHFPDRKQKVLHRLESLRGGKLNDPRFGTRMRGEGAFAQQTAQVFEIYKQKIGFSERSFNLSTASFRRLGGTQLGLF